jgi:hypothetical protein
MDAENSVLRLCTTRFRRGMWRPPDASWSLERHRTLAASGEAHRRRMHGTVRLK